VAVFNIHTFDPNNKGYEVGERLRQADLSQDALAEAKEMSKDHMVSVVKVNATGAPYRVYVDGVQVA
jgi:hypothetical protein